MTRKLWCKEFNIGKSSILLLILIIAACTPESTNDDHSDIILDEETLENPKPIPLSTISTNSRYMIIDTTGGNYIRRIKKFCSTGEDFLIVDDRNTVFIVNHEGQVLSKFRHVGNGPGEYQDIATVTVNPETQDIYLKARKLQKLIKYDRHGVMQVEKSIQDIYVNKLIFVKSNLVAFSGFPAFLHYKSSPKFVFIYDEGLNLVHTEDHPIWKTNQVGFNNNPLMWINIYNLANGLIFYEMYQNGRIFKMDLNNNWNIEKWMRILIDDNLSDDELLENAKNFPDGFNGKNYIDHIVATPHLLFLTVINGTMHNIRSVLYDIRDQSFISVEDFAGYRRFWDDVNGFFSFWPMGYLPSTNELYYFQNPGKMMQEYNEAIEISPNSFHRVDSNTLNLFEKAKAMGNPVIQFVKLED